MNGYIYKFTYIPTNKIYVGQHSGDTFDEKYWGSGVLWLKILSKANKLVDVKREVLEWCFNVSKEYLTERENYWIKTLNALDEDIGYNQCEALPNFWLGHHHTDETKEIIGKLSINRRWVHNNYERKFINKNEVDAYLKSGWKEGSGLTRSDEIKKLVSKKNSNRVRLTDGEHNVFIPKECELEYINKGYFRGTTKTNNVHHSEFMTNGEIERKVNYAAQEKKLKLGWVFGNLNDFSDEDLVNIHNNYLKIKNENREIGKLKFSNKRKGHPVSEETREKLRKANLGKEASEETRKKLSISATGRKHSDETKQKLREINTGRRASEETKRKLRESHLGSQSDRIWINNGVFSKRVTEEDFLNIYIKNGFIKGRKITNNEQ